MKTYKSIFAGAVAVLLMSVIVNAEILDQQQLLEDGGVAFWSDLPQVQTFTSGISGKLVKVDLALTESPDTFNEMVHVSIVAWNINQPGTVLGSSSFYIDDFTGSVDFSSQSIFLTAGSIYGIMLTNDLSYYSVPDPYRNTGIRVKWDTDPYAEGSLWTGYDNAADWQEREGTDVVFATYMADPEYTVELKKGDSCVKFEDAVFEIDDDVYMEACLGEDGAVETDTFFVMVDGMPTDITVTVKAGKCMESGSFLDGPTLNLCGFRIGLLISIGDPVRYGFPVTSDDIEGGRNGPAALSNITFCFDDAIVIEPEEGTTAVSRTSGPG